jgi:uridine phosphorylase
MTDVRSGAGVVPVALALYAETARRLRSSAMSWPFDTSEPFVVPEHAVEAQRQSAGLTPEEWALPPTLVATFQREAYARLEERAGVDLQSPVTARLPRGVTAGNALGSVDGVPVVIAIVTVGAPATAMVMEIAIARGVRQMLVVGSAGSLQPTLPLGAAVVVTGAEREDGTSHHYLRVGEVVAADTGLTDLLESSALVRGRAWTIDAPYRETTGAILRHRKAGVAVVEMEAAAMFAVARLRGIRAGLIVAVSDELLGHQWHVGFSPANYLDTLIQAADATMDAAAQLGTSG